MLSGLRQIPVTIALASFLVGCAAESHVLASTARRILTSSSWLALASRLELLRQGCKAPSLASSGLRMVGFSTFFARPAARRVSLEITTENAGVLANPIHLWDFCQALSRPEKVGR
jgi:hypothetical protein